MKVNFFLIILFIAVLISLPIKGYTGISERTCIPCHDCPVFVALSIELNAPNEVGLNANFEICAIVRNVGGYLDEQLEASVDFTKAKNISIAKNEDKIKYGKSLQPGEVYIFRWNLVSSNNISKNLLFVKVSTFVIDRTLVYREKAYINISKLPYLFSIYSITANVSLKKSYEFEIENRGEEPMLNLSFSIPESISQAVKLSPLQDDTDWNSTTNSFSEIEVNEKKKLRIEVYGENETRENITIRWYVKDKEFEKNLPIYFVKSVKGGVSNIEIIRYLFRIFGFINVFLLALALYTGSRKFFSGRKRIKFHCGISLIVLVLAILHGYFLLSIGFRGIIFAPRTIVGYSSAISMGALGIVGILKKRIEKKIGFKNWRITHKFIGIGCISFVLIHLAFGTTMKKTISFIDKSISAYENVITIALSVLIVAQILILFILIKRRERRSPPT
ncbi:MAG: hypothetical protein AB1779_08080 [Candidatus Thermoplasmatota archaeon]